MQFCSIGNRTGGEIVSSGYTPEPELTVTVQSSVTMVFPVATIGVVSAGSEIVKIESPVITPELPDPIWYN